MNLGGDGSQSGELDNESIVNSILFPHAPLKGVALNQVQTKSLTQRADITTPLNKTSKSTN
jgi:hypothetical protein